MHGRPRHSNSGGVLTALDCGLLIKTSRGEEEGVIEAGKWEIRERNLKKRTSGNLPNAAFGHAKCRVAHRDGDFSLVQKEDGLVSPRALRSLLASRRNLNHARTEEIEIR